MSGTYSLGLFCNPPLGELQPLGPQMQPLPYFDATLSFHRGFRLAGKKLLFNFVVDDPTSRGFIGRHFFLLFDYFIVLVQEGFLSALEKCFSPKFIAGIDDVEIPHSSFEVLGEKLNHGFLLAQDRRAGERLGGIELPPLFKNQ